MKKLVTICAVITAATMLVGAWTASAQTYTIEHPHSQGIGSGTITFNGGSSTIYAYLGRFIMEPIPTNALPANYPVYSISTIHGLETGFFSDRLEPDQPIGVGHGAAYQYPFSIGSMVGMDGIDAGDAALVNELFGLYSPLLQNDPTGPYSGGTFRTAAAALQLAIWKVNLDRTTETLGSWDFSSGLMQVASVNIPLESGASAKADAVALSMLNSLTGSGPMASGLQGLQNASYQDLLIQEIPEPATLALVGLGVAALMVFRRRR